MSDPDHLAGTSPKISLLTLPPELRFQIYGYVFELPYPRAIGDLLRNIRPAPFLMTYTRVCSQMRNEILREWPSVVGSHAVFAFNDSPASSWNLQRNVDGAPLRSRLQIRHLRMTSCENIFAAGQIDQLNPSRLKEVGFDYLVDHFDYNWLRGKITDVADLDQIAKCWLPRLQTLTLDIGKINYLRNPCRSKWAADWKTEPENLRDERYRGLVGRVRTAIPSDVRERVQITINAFMNPEGYDAILNRNVEYAGPCVNIKLVYSNARVNVEERCQAHHRLVSSGRNLWPENILIGEVRLVRRLDGDN